MEGKSRILVVGSSGNLGSLLVRASLAAGHPTFALARPSAFSDPLKSALLRSYQEEGAVVLEGSLEDFESLVQAVRKVEIVICAVASKQALLQEALIRAIKKTGCVKRFIPADFGMDPLKISIIGMDNGLYERRLHIRRLIESEGIPHTYICSNYFMSFLLPSLIQPGLSAPPRDKVKIFGNGNTKAIFLKECDVANYTICSVDDPRTLNKVVYLRPPGNICSINDLVGLWEMKIGYILEREYIPEDQLLKIIQETTDARKMDMVFIYSSFVKGDHTSFDIDPSSGVDGIQLYPQVKYTTVDEYLDTLL